MSTKYLNIIAFSAIAFLACSFSATPVNALSIDSNSGLHARHAHIGHVFAKRAPSKRCKARTPAAGGTSTTSSTTPSSTLNAPKPATTTNNNNTPRPPATTPVSPPASNSGSTGKAGLAWAVWQGDTARILANFKTNHVSAAYNWGPFKIPGAEAAGYEDVPMLWGPKDIADWKRLVVRGYARHVLGFNEPNHKDQAYLDPGYAAALWRDNMLGLRDLGIALISPATTSGDDGLIWMQNFLAACGGSHCVDKIALHWYGNSGEEFIKYLQKWYAAFNKPIWVTEFACMDFVRGVRCADVQGFARTVRQFMDRTWWVEKYFPFDIAYNLGNVDSVNQLLGGDLRPTPLAWVYFG